MERHNANAERIAAFLAGHPKVTRVHYPGPLITRSTRSPSGRCAASAHDRLALGSLDSGTLLNSVRLMSLAESLGGVET
jgi:cystathionine beta-lyase/cystathionine gamma-synthase